MNNTPMITQPTGPAATSSAMMITAMTSMIAVTRNPRMAPPSHGKKLPVNQLANALNALDTALTTLEPSPRWAS